MSAPKFYRPLRDPEKGEHSSLFRVLARTPFNSCVRVLPFLPPRARARGRAPPPRCGRLQAHRRTELLPTISPFAIDLRAPSTVPVAGIRTLARVVAVGPLDWGNCLTD